MLYHYTSPKVIMSIIREEGIILRFSRYDCLNDTSEGKEAVAIQQEVCETLRLEYSTSPAKLELLDRIASLRPDFKSIYVGESAPVSGGNLPASTPAAASIPESSVSAVPYICSFSRERDALTMWNYYTKGTHYEGYNVGIDVEGLCLEVFDPKDHGQGKYGSVTSLFEDRAGSPSSCLSEDSAESPFSSISEDRAESPSSCLSSGDSACVDACSYSSCKPKLKCEWWSVIYDKQQQADKIRAEIERILANGSFSESEYVAQLNNWAIRFKSEIFRHEEEERLICYVPEDETHSGDDLDDYIQFRVVNGCLVPYLDVLIADKGALKEITIGPLIEEQLAANTMELFLRLKGYSDVKLYTSEAPIRY